MSGVGGPPGDEQELGYRRGASGFQGCCWSPGGRIGLKGEETA